jgi:hypothetical protein
MEQHLENYDENRSAIYVPLHVVKGVTVLHARKIEDAKQTGKFSKKKWISESNIKHNKKHKK